MPDDNAAQEVQDEAQSDCEGDAANPSGKAFLAEESSDAEHGEGAEIIKEDAGDEHTGGKSPAEETVHDALRKLDEREGEGCHETGTDASADGKEDDGKHGEKGDGAAPREFKYPDEAQDCGEGYHDRSFN